MTLDQVRDAMSEALRGYQWPTSVQGVSTTVADYMLDPDEELGIEGIPPGVAMQVSLDVVHEVRGRTLITGWGVLVPYAIQPEVIPVMCSQLIASVRHALEVRT